MKPIAKLYFYDKEDLKLAIDGGEWMDAMQELDNWLRGKEKYESGLQDKKGEELEHYVDAYSTAREELYEILQDRGLSFGTE